MIKTAKQLKDLIRNLSKKIAAIVTVPLDDGVSFRLKKISEIMDEAEYPGVCVGLETKFDGVITLF